MGSKCVARVDVGRGHRFKGTALLLVGLGLAACKGPADQGLVTGGTQAEYRASLDPLIPKLSKHEVEAFDWAVSDLDLTKLHGKYPGASPRKIIRGEVREVLDTYPGKIEALEKTAAKEAPLRAELGKITAPDTEFAIDKDFFGLQPVIMAIVTNGSRYPVSQLKWNAALYLDGADIPVVQTVLTSDFRQNGGLRPGGQFTVRLPVGFVRGDEAWTTLEIRNAAKRRVVLEPVLDSILDFGERAYLADDPVPQIERMKAAIKDAKDFSDI